ncbi:flagellar protein FlaG protein [Desulforamulus reducens MI-1]|uniref:Flagellar protein FlaG protein n=1 Tax=Desulforamulus reducens (strain ATCC BAA-1160 / DSM 100696 / MI-1) TaxID=349161 RepID=A4J770_DESRM|nr:flagellar protein FlaG [Desulforamulus reducens]ABO50923.1 flagellar protein FlaG protein [Desulforamulus reducens MI-1]
MIDGLGAVQGMPMDYPQQSSLQEQTSVKRVDEAQGAVDNSFNKSAEYGDKQGEVNKGQAEQAIDKLNKTMETYNTELRFKLHEKSGEYIVKIINPKDDSVIREIPPERVLNMVAYFKEMLGIVVDKFA